MDAAHISFHRHVNFFIKTPPVGITRPTGMRARVVWMVGLLGVKNKVTNGSKRYDIVAEHGSWKQSRRTHGGLRSTGDGNSCAPRKRAVQPVIPRQPAVQPVSSLCG